MCFALTESGNDFLSITLTTKYELPSMYGPYTVPAPNAKIVSAYLDVNVFLDKKRSLYWKSEFLFIKLSTSVLAINLVFKSLMVLTTFCVSSDDGFTSKLTYSTERASSLDLN